ncbi:MAG TPA: rhodanese-like domain-containing protein [Longilinea sp.]|nr:rhodanese-like domain-containing protein [Longilinea sp.]
MARSNKNNDTNSAVPLILIAAGIVLIIIVLIWQLFMSQTNTAQVGAIQPTVTSEIPYPEITRVSLGDAYSAFQNKAVIFIDVRSVDNFKQSHIAGATNLPLDQLEVQIPQMDLQAWIIPYCT